MPEPGVEPVVLRFSKSDALSVELFGKAPSCLAAHADVTGEAGVYFGSRISHSLFCHDVERFYHSQFPTSSYTRLTIHDDYQKF